MSVFAEIIAVFFANYYFYYNDFNYFFSYEIIKFIFEGYIYNVSIHFL